MKLPFKIDLTGKVCVVTGGAGVLCSGFAKTLAACGASASAAHRCDDERPGEGAGAAGYQQTAGRPRERVLFQRARNSAEIK